MKKKVGLGILEGWESRSWGGGVWRDIIRVGEELEGIGVDFISSFEGEVENDDYKVVFGAAESLEKTAFQVFSLKSNVWKHDGHVNYRFWGDVQIGTLCNGALHWIGYQVTKGFIISFDLSKEVFKEINQHDDVIHKCSSLAINKGYVCNYNEYHEKLLVMKKYNVKQYWRYRGRYLCTLGMKSKEPYAFIPSTAMPSLISPYLQEGNE
ncbi:putative F-box domain-containing protein [Tanacetum coccineum]